MKQFQASLDGLSKKGNIHTFIFSAPAEKVSSVKVGDVVTILGTTLSISEIDGEYLTFQIELEALMRTDLGDLVVGDIVPMELS